MDICNPSTVKGGGRRINGAWWIPVLPKERVSSLGKRQKGIQVSINIHIHVHTHTHHRQKDTKRKSLIEDTRIFIIQCLIVLSSTE